MWILFGLFVWTIVGFLYVYYTEGSNESISEFVLLLPSGILSCLILAVCGASRKEEE